MFPKNILDMQILLTKYNLPVWSTITTWFNRKDGREGVHLFIGPDRKRPVITIEFDMDEYLINDNFNSTYRELKAYLDTHYTPVKLPRWPM